MGGAVAMTQLFKMLFSQIFEINFILLFLLLRLSFEWSRSVWFYDQKFVYIFRFTLLGVLPKSGRRIIDIGIYHFQRKFILIFVM
jgi:hypothetical protein